MSLSAIVTIQVSGQGVTVGGGRTSSADGSSQRTIVVPGNGNEVVVDLPVTLGDIGEPYPDPNARTEVLAISTDRLVYFTTLLENEDQDSGYIFPGAPLIVQPRLETYWSGDAFEASGGPFPSGGFDRIRFSVDEEGPDANVTIIHQQDSTENEDSTTDLTSSASSVAAGSTLAFTATVSADDQTPTGTVTFQEGSSVLGVATLDPDTGIGTFVITTLPVGDHSITALYSGDTTHNPSVSEPYVQTIT